MAASNLVLTGANLPPNTCLFCATNPVDEDGEMRPFVHAEGMDVNWGESVYICWECCGVIADLVDRPDAEKVAAVLRGAKLQKKHNARLSEENDKLRKVCQGLVDGESMMAEAKELLNG